MESLPPVLPPVGDLETQSFLISLETRAIFWLRGVVWVAHEVGSTRKKGRAIETHTTYNLEFVGVVKIASRSTSRAAPGTN